MNGKQNKYGRMVVQYLIKNYRMKMTQITINFHVAFFLDNHDTNRMMKTLQCVSLNSSDTILNIACERLRAAENMSLCDNHWPPEEAISVIQFKICD